MFVPLRYKLAMGLAPRVRVAQAQQMVVPGANVSARNQAVVPSETLERSPS